MINFRLDPHSGVPTYLQLVQQVKHAIRLGLLRPGDQLPTAKDVVRALAINPNTVLKAYRELERDGLVTGQPGMGTFVKHSLTPAVVTGHGRLRARLVAWTRAARDAGLDRDDIAALFAATLQEAFEEGVA